MNQNDVIAVIRSLLSSVNFSYSIDTLIKDFKNETGVDLPLFGYNNVKDFLRSIPNTVELEGLDANLVKLVKNDKSAHIISLVERQDSRFRKREKANHVEKLKFQSKNMPNVFSNISNFPSEDFSTTLKSKSSKTFFPDNLLKLKDRRKVVEFCEDISDFAVNLHLPVGEYIEVQLTEIYTPDKFFFHLRNQKNNLLQLMNALQYFYTNNNKLYEMPDTAIQPNHICVALDEQLEYPKWQRAVILKKLDYTRVRVKLVDYGRTITIFKKDIRFLDSRFSYLPRQAIQGSLAGVQPLKNESGWTNCATRRFIDLALEKELIAGVVDVNTKDFGVSLALTNTLDKEIHINDTLVEEGFAEYNEEALKNNTNEKSCTHPEVSGFSNTCKGSFDIFSSGSIPCLLKNDKLKELFS